MSFAETVNYYAKAVVAGLGAVVTFGIVIVDATKDGTFDGGDVSTVASAAVVLIATVVGVIAKRNIPPEA